MWIWRKESKNWRLDENLYGGRLSAQHYLYEINLHYLYEIIDLIKSHRFSFFRGFQNKMSIL